MDQVYVWSANLNGFELLLVWLAAVAFNFIPSIIAFSRRHPNRYGIVVLNALFGWTGIGWLILLVWSLTNWHGSRPLRA